MLRPPGLVGVEVDGDVILAAHLNILDESQMHTRSPGGFSYREK